MTAHIHRPRRSLSVALATVLALAACSSSPGGASTSESTGAEPSGGSGSMAETTTAEPTPGTELTACELVAPADIEAALSLAAGAVGDGTLEQAPTGIDDAVNECRYEGDWGKLIVNATPTAGASVFRSLAKVYGDSAEALDVGDGGFWFEDNDRGYFLKGSVMVFMQFVFIADGTKFREPTIALGEALIAKI
jgi:hypothetical protein